MQWRCPVIRQESESYKGTISPLNLGVIRHRHNDVLDRLQSREVLVLTAGSISIVYIINAYRSWAVWAMKRREPARRRGSSHDLDGAPGPFGPVAFLGGKRPAGRDML